MISKYLSNVDLFGIPVTMNFSGKEKATTSFGGLCSILFFIYLGWAIVNGIQDLLSTNNPQIISYDSYSENPEELILSLDEFPIAFAMRTPNELLYQLYVDESIYKINFFHTVLQRTTLENGTKLEDWKDTPINIEKCFPEYFGELAGSFSDLNLTLMYCISRNQSELEKLRLEGVFTSKTYQFLTATISECDNATSSVPCASPDIIEAYLNGGWFSTLYGNMVVNPRNFEHPNLKFRDLYYTMLGTKNYRETEIELGRVRITTDKGWIVETPNVATYVKVDKITEFLQFKPHPQKRLISCIFQLSKLENYYSRTYKKVPGVLAEIGGLANAALMILFIVTNPYFKLKFREALMNELFDVKALPKQSNQKSPNTISSKRKLLKNPNETRNNQDSNHQKFSETLAESQNGLWFQRSQIKAMKTFDSMEHVPATTSPNKQRIQYEEMTKDKNSISGKIFSGSKALSVLNLHKNVDQFPTKESAANEADLRRQFYFTRRVSSKIASSQHDDLNSRNIRSLNELDTYLKSSFNQTQLGCHKEKAPPLKLKFLEVENIEHPSFCFESPTEVFNEQGKKETRAVKEVQLKTNDIITKITNHSYHLEEEKYHQALEVNLEKKEESQSSGSDELEVFNDSTPVITNVKIWEYVCSFFFQSDSLKQKMNLIDEGAKNIDERLDVINILKKLREIDKLKALLLEPEQLLLFNNLPKPEIFPKGFKGLRRADSFSQEILKRSKFVEDCATKQQLLECYEKIKDKTEKTQIDERLLEIFSKKKS